MEKGQVSSILSSDQPTVDRWMMIVDLMKNEETWSVDVGDEDNNEIHVIYRHFAEGRKVETTLVVTDVMREILHDY